MRARKLKRRSPATPDPVDRRSRLFDWPERGAHSPPRSGDPIGAPSRRLRLAYYGLAPVYYRAPGGGV